MISLCRYSSFDEETMVSVKWFCRSGAAEANFRCLDGTKILKQDILLCTCSYSLVHNYEFLGTVNQCCDQWIFHFCQFSSMHDLDFATSYVVTNAEVKFRPKQFIISNIISTTCQRPFLFQNYLLLKFVWFGLIYLGPLCSRFFAWICLTRWFLRFWWCLCYDIRWCLFLVSILLASLPQAGKSPASTPEQCTSPWKPCTPQE